MLVEDIKHALGKYSPAQFKPKEHWRFTCDITFQGDILFDIVYT